MMKTAFAVWEERIAPVFDVARHLRMVDTDDGRIVRADTVSVPAVAPAEKAQWLAARGIRVLVCGAISRPFQRMIAAQGIQVIPFVAGELPRVERAWLAGVLEQGPFAMPGCRRRRRSFRWIDSTGGDGDLMQGRNGRGGGGGGGNRQGARGGGAGRVGGSAAGGPGGACVCPKCAYRESHERGVPCNMKQCPKCGATLARE